MRAAFGAEKVEEEVSSYYIANEARVMSEGLDVATDPKDWILFQTMSAEGLAEELIKLAHNVRLPAFKRHKRGPKKPVVGPFAAEFPNGPTRDAARSNKTHLA